MRYAMVCDKRVIAVLEDTNKIPQWPPDDKGNAVDAILCDSSVKVGYVYDAESCVFSEHKKKRKPTKTERILEMVSKSKEEIENAAIDAYTEELIEGGML